MLFYPVSGAERSLTGTHQVHPIAAVEIEVSPWSYEQETKNGKCWVFRELLSPRPDRVHPALF